MFLCVCVLPVLVASLAGKMHGVIFPPDVSGGCRGGGWMDGWEGWRVCSSSAVDLCAFGLERVERVGAYFNGTMLLERRHRQPTKGIN